MADVSQPSSLNLEPNPFEQSFASNTQQGHGAATASTEENQSQSGQPGAVGADQRKHSAHNFSNGAPELGQKTPIPGIDKIVTPLPLVPGAPPFGPGALTSGLGVFGATSPAGWLPPRFGPITPGALNTPSFDAFAGHHAAANGANANPMFPHVAPGHTPHVPGVANGHDSAGIPRMDSFAGTPRGVLPLESPGINPIIGLNHPGAGSQIPSVPAIPEGAAVQNGAVPKPQGENAAANGLYMLSQNQASHKSRETPHGPVEKPPDGAEHFAVTPESQRQEPPQQPQNRPSVDSTGTSAGEEPLHHAPGPNATAHPVRRDSGPQAHPTKKRSMREIDSEVPHERPKSELGSEDDQGQKRRWSNQQHSPETENEEKRKQFLERNRIAAIKCRARKKQWVDNLQQKVDMYTRANDELVQKNEKVCAELDELRQFIVRYHDMRSLPQHILHIVQGRGDAAGAAAGAAAAATATHDFGSLPQQHVLPGAIPGHGSAPLQPQMPPSVTPVPPQGPQSMTPSMVPSPASQRAVHNRADPRYPPQTAPSHYAPSRQHSIQQPIQQLHRASQ